MKTAKFLSLLLGLCILLASCAATGVPAGNETTAVTDETTAAKEEPAFVYDQVVLIGVDGAGAFFKQANTPGIDEIFADGSVTYDVITSYPSISAQCWGSMLHGVKPEFHRLTNGSLSVHEYRASEYPSVFQILHDANPDAVMASFCNWSPINKGIVEENIGVTKGTGDDPEVTEKILGYLDENKPDFLFVQYDSVDGAGHGNGYGSDSRVYLAAIEAVDALIKQIYDKYVSKGWIDNTLFIVTADHGGTTGGGHGGNTDAEMQIMLAVKGQTVVSGGVAEDCEVRDIAAIAAYALGLDIPETWTGRVPSGIFKDYTAKERVEAYVEVSENRKHETVPTPEGGITSVSSLSSDAIIAYLPFDGNADDATGKTVTSENNKVYYSDAYFGEGITLDDGYIKLADTKFGTESFSVAFWIKSNVTDGSPCIFANKAIRKENGKGFALSINASDIVAMIGDGKSSFEISASTPLDSAYGWMYVVFTFDRENRKITTYYDFNKSNVGDIPESYDAVPFDAFELSIGQDGTEFYDSLSAMMDDFVLYKGVLTEAQISDMATYYGVK